MGGRSAGDVVDTRRVCTVSRWLAGLYMSARWRCVGGVGLRYIRMRCRVRYALKQVHRVNAALGPYRKGLVSEREPAIERNRNRTERRSDCDLFRRAEKPGRFVYGSQAGVSLTDDETNQNCGSIFHRQ